MQKNKQPKIKKGPNEKGPSPSKKDTLYDEKSPLRDYLDADIRQYYGKWRRSRKKNNSSKGSFSTSNVSENNFSDGSLS